ncbi:magnesium-translocating P-type ATPase [Rhizobium sp. S95]|uniref:Magnesium-transporting ATPase, P-type 1 n=1 Tax=Ciceribacter sichuanensis TaxID=2949647 RepID=A0AAJ1F8Q2_9HYPH|nr:MULTISPECIES: magnesium-translocating P-type ATPase [unclassified Ciceribacter]MCM2398469.1 magnesium-translocating P-type ATPase [Ciceribacter sp. S95]MCO5958474.1 magnesium-translocating P-type ATPase [Ciceribacter sp. S101]
MSLTPGNSTNGDIHRNAYWSLPPDDLFSQFHSGKQGLTSAEAAERLRHFGPNSLKDENRWSALRIFLSQFESPLVLILVAAAAISIVVGEWREAIIISLIVLASCILSFYQEYSASVAVEKLKERIGFKARVRRDGKFVSIAAAEVVPGDIVAVSAGDLIPADAILISATDLFVSQSALTGETFPVEKRPGELPADTALANRASMLFTGASVRSGMGEAIVVETGVETEFGKITAHLQEEAPETDFARGIRRFGYLMTRVALIMVVVIFAGNILLQRPLVDSLLFSLAIAVGITPELLPAIVSLTLSSGARRMATGGVIVRRLASIENLGSMNLLCTDKTGTLTEGVVSLDRVEGPLDGAPDGLLRLATLNARLQNGMANPLDGAIDKAATAAAIQTDPSSKIGEIPYDFVRKRLSVIVRDGDGDLLIAKGALANILEVSTHVMHAGELKALDDEVRAALAKRYADWSSEGFRVLGIATRRFAPSRERYGHDDETGLAFAGFLLFSDPPKNGIAKTLAAMAEREVKVKVISGDNRFVAAHLARTIGLPSAHILTGEELSKLTDEALAARAVRTDLFVEIDPNQKQRIVAALRGRGHVVGYLGDGINDAPALHEADIGISVEGAADVAQQAADMVLVDKSLDVLLEGIDNGRRTFANTMKYVSCAISSNFGNMISMSFASFLLPFQPLLAKQILLNNFLADIPSMAIAGDNVDPAAVMHPQRWNIAYVQRFMIVFGLISTLFDFLTFGFLLALTGEHAAIFQTGWFVESLITQLLTVLVIRTRAPFFRSRPGRWLLLSTLVVSALAVALPYLPGSEWFGFVHLPAGVLVGLTGITFAYLASTEIAKHWFFSKPHDRLFHRKRRRGNTMPGLSDRNRR